MCFVAQEATLPILHLRFPRSVSGIRASNRYLCCVCCVCFVRAKNMRALTAVDELGLYMYM